MLKFTICRPCHLDRSNLSVMRRALLFLAIAFCVFGTLSTFTAHAQPESSDQYRIQELERRANTTEQNTARISVLEAQYAETREQLIDIKTWTRGIGMAVLIAVLEKLLSAFGIRVRRKTEGAE